MANSILQNIQGLKAYEEGVYGKPYIITPITADSLITGNHPVDKYHDVALLPDRVLPSPSPTTPKAQEEAAAHTSLDSALQPVDDGRYVDIYNLKAQFALDAQKQLETKQDDPQYQENTQCTPDANELLNIVLVFIAWTGMDPEGISPDGTEYRDWTSQEMLDELGRVKNFLLNDFTQILDLKGVMAKIHGAMFIRELEEFTESELTAYGTMFHMNFETLDYMQESVLESFSELLESGEATPEEIERRQDENEIIYYHELCGLILQHKVWMLERLRLWRWREEVFLGHAGEELEDYPGIPCIFEFESATDLFEAGISDYYLRVGEVKRENLMERYYFFDLYHMAGILAKGVKREVKFDTSMVYEDLADLIIQLLEEMEIDPRHIITPLGVQIIHNKERGEVLFNCYRNRLFTEDEEYDNLYLACSHAGVDRTRVTLTDMDDGTVISVIENKPEYVLIEELISQYVSPQFYTGIESHRNYMEALEDFVTVDGSKVHHGEDGDFLFYGVGDGMSLYRAYRPSELAFIFNATRMFIDPFSFRKDPNNPLRWSRFSLQSIQRLILVVLPQLRAKSCTDGKIYQAQPTLAERQEQFKQGRADIDHLEETIMSIMQEMDFPSDQPPTANKPFQSTSTSGLESQNPEAEAQNLISEEPTALDEIPNRVLKAMIDPKNVQEDIITELRNGLEDIRLPLMEFLAFLHNTGMQFSDWDEKMTRIGEDSIQAALEDDPRWKHIDPETTVNLTQKIFTMVSLDFEKYIDIRTPLTNYGNSIKALRLVKHYSGAYRIDWNDELSTIGGHCYRMIEANDLSLYQHLKTSGNWLMATANYYSVRIFDQSIGENEIDLVGQPTNPEGYIIL